MASGLRLRRSSRLRPIPVAASSSTSHEEEQDARHMESMKHDNRCFVSVPMDVDENMFYFDECGSEEEINSKVSTGPLNAVGSEDSEAASTVNLRAKKIISKL